MFRTLNSIHASFIGKKTIVYIFDFYLNFISSLFISYFNVAHILILFTTSNHYLCPTEKFARKDYTTQQRILKLNNNDHE